MPRIQALCRCLQENLSRRESKKEGCSKELNLSDSGRFEIAEMILPQKAYETAYSKIKTLDTKNTFNHFNIKEDSCSSTGLIVVLAKKF